MRRASITTSACEWTAAFQDEMSEWKFLPSRIDNDVARRIGKDVRDCLDLRSVAV